MTFAGTPSPHLEEQPDIIRLHSPLSLSGAYIYILRQYFKQGTITPWTWSDNVTSTGILIESGFERGTELNDSKPGIYVSLGQVAYQKVVLGDKDSYTRNVLEKRLEHYYGIVQCDMRISCISPRRGESALLGDTVLHFLTASSRLIMQTFALRDLTSIVMNSTVNYELDETLWSTGLMFRCEYESRWATIPVAVPLRGITTEFGSNASQELLKITLHTYGVPNI